MGLMAGGAHGITVGSQVGFDQTGHMLWGRGALGRRKTRLQAQAGLSSELGPHWWLRG